MKNIELKARLLVVEDDFDLREALADTLELAGCKVTQAESAEQALICLEAQPFDMVISDINMGAMDGMALLRHVRNSYPQLPMLLITAYGSVSASVEAIKEGAADYLVKPFKPQLLVETVSRHVGFASVGDEDGPVAEALASQQLLQLAQRVAETDSTVLICGESGTGKEVLARYIHQSSSRKNQPFVAINCAAIPENMLEGMLFGHEKGAFTGAYSSSPGKFEQANGGTLLLDEISEMDIGLQAKLLRVIQEREVERLGGKKPIPLDIRFLATTNRNLAEEVKGGRFREDLFYRLSVFPLQWQPLRARREDILPIANRLLASHLKKMGRQSAHFNSAAERELLAHDWPGNVRELDNVIQRALIMQPGSEISDCHLRINPFDGMAMNVESLQLGVADPIVNSITPAMSEVDDSSGLLGEEASRLGNDLQRREFEIILRTLKDLRGSRKHTAEKLGISPRTLRYKIARMRDFGIDPELVLEAG